MIVIEIANMATLLALSRCCITFRKLVTDDIYNDVTVRQLLRRGFDISKRYDLIEVLIKNHSKEALRKTSETLSKACQYFVGERYARTAFGFTMRKTS